MPRSAKRAPRGRAFGLPAAAFLACAWVGCARPRSTGPSDRFAWSENQPACPANAEREPSGRCACTPGDFILLGACVPPAVGDAFCGPAARMGSEGCVFRRCAQSEMLDAATGVCTPRVTLPHSGIAACGDRSFPLLDTRQTACVAPDATCPRGTHWSRSGGTCLRDLRCPPGALLEGNACRPMVTADGTMKRVVDVGGWAALALGYSGGSGSPELCRPLEQRPGLLGLGPGESLTLGIDVALVIPDQDVSRLHARARVVDASGRPSTAALDDVVSGAVSTLLESLRGLGGEASTAALEVEVRCTLRGSLLGEDGQ